MAKKVTTSGGKGMPMFTNDRMAGKGGPGDPMKPKCVCGGGKCVCGVASNPK